MKIICAFCIINQIMLNNLISFKIYYDIDNFGKIWYYVNVVHLYVLFRAVNIALRQGSKINRKENAYEKQEYQSDKLLDAEGSLCKTFICTELFWAREIFQTQK